MAASALIGAKAVKRTHTRSVTAISFFFIEIHLHKLLPGAKRYAARDKLRIIPAPFITWEHYTRGLLNLQYLIERENENFDA
jgi:hypothetical protein